MEQHVWTIKDFNQDILINYLDQNRLYLSSPFFCVEKKWQMFLRGDNIENNKCQSISLWLQSLNSESILVNFSFTILRIHSDGGHFCFPPSDVIFTLQHMWGCSNIFKRSDQNPANLIIIVTIQIPFLSRISSCLNEIKNQNQWLAYQYDHPKKNYDLVFITKQTKKSLYAHKIVLQDSSKQWQEFLLPYVDNKQILNLNIRDEDYEIYKTMLIFIYKGFSCMKNYYNSKTRNWKFTLLIYKLSQNYKYASMHAWSSLLLLDIMCHENVFTILDAATKWKDYLLEKKCIYFLSSNMNANSLITSLFEKPHLFDILKNSTKKRKLSQLINE